VTRVDVSALVVNYNSTKLALDMLRSLAAQGARAPDGRPLVLEFVLVDNASPQRDDATMDEIRRFGEEVLPGKVVLHDRNAGYAGGMNLALEHATGEHLLVLNPALVFLPGCLEALYGHVVANPGTGAAGPVGFWDRGREVRLPPNILPTLGDLFAVTLAHVSPAWNRRYVERRLRHALPVYLAEDDVRLDMLSGACLMIPRAVVDELGMFFDDGFPLYYEDTDLFRRIEGICRRLVCVGTAHIAHFYNRSGTTDPAGAMARYWKARSYYYGKWYGLVGRACEALCRRLVRTAWARRRAGSLRTGIIDLGDVDEPPVLELGRDCERYIIEACQDPAFLLAAGIIGRGPTWTPGDSFWYAFGDSEYYLRCIDLSSGEPEELVTYRFRRVGHPAFVARRDAEGRVPDALAER